METKVTYAARPARASCRTGARQEVRRTWARALVEAAASCLLLAACGGAAPPPHAPSPPVAPSPPEPDVERSATPAPVSCDRAYPVPGDIRVGGRGLAVVVPDLAIWYYAAASRHPAHMAVSMSSFSVVDSAVDAIREALAARGEALDDYYLQAVAVRPNEGSGLPPTDVCTRQTAPRVPRPAADERSRGGLGLSR